MSESTPTHPERLEKWADHLRYEMDMLVRTSRVATEERDKYRRWAYLEAFLIHYRVLAEFLTVDENKKRKKVGEFDESDVTATDFNPGWRCLVEFAEVDDIHKFVAHLTTRRSQRGRQWMVQEMTSTMLEALGEFRTSLDHDIQHWVKVPETPAYPTWSFPSVSTTESSPPTFYDFRQQT